MIHLLKRDREYDGYGFYMVTNCAAYRDDVRLAVYLKEVILKLQPIKKAEILTNSERHKVYLIISEI